MEILIEKIIPNPDQPRKAFDQGELESLSESILQHGLINPISVEQADGFYILIDGERRWRAAKMAGLTTIEASVRPSMNSDGSVHRLTWALVANLQRSEMNPIEQAEGFMALRNQGFSIGEISEMVGLHQSSVSNFINLLTLEDEIKDLYKDRRLPLDYDMLRVLKTIERTDLRIEVANLAAKYRMTGPGVVRMIKRMNLGDQKKNKKSSGFHRKNETIIRKTDMAGGHWNMIAQLGYVPAYPGLVRAAEQVCKNCSLYDIASSQNCRDCPAVDLLRSITSEIGVDGK